MITQRFVGFWEQNTQKKMTKVKNFERDARPQDFRKSQIWRDIRNQREKSHQKLSLERVSEIKVEKTVTLLSQSLRFHFRKINSWISSTREVTQLSYESQLKWLINVVRT